MARNEGVTFPPIDPNLQVSFYHKLQSIRGFYLHEALANTVGLVPLDTIDEQLKAFVPASPLKAVAKSGLRGETFFPVPCVLEANPFLLGYYRLLLGLSQKEFYSKGPFGRFKRMEAHGEITRQAASSVAGLCVSLTQTAIQLLAGIGPLSLSLLHELQLLTLGPQLRGSENTKIGQAATKNVYALMKGLVAPHVLEATQKTIVMKNASGRKVLIEFSSDPDIRITETLPDDVRPVVSIEVKGGTDYSNIHNRLGEAEKSHQKAKARGFFEFWTIVRVEVDEETAKRESPTTSRFFNLDRISRPGTGEHETFRNTLSSILGIQITS